MCARIPGTLSFVGPLAHEGVPLKLGFAFATSSWKRTETNLQQFRFLWAVLSQCFAHAHLEELTLTSFSYTKALSKYWSSWQTESDNAL